MKKNHLSAAALPLPWIPDIHAKLSLREYTAFSFAD
jgi:hypothetical protein